MQSTFVILFLSIALAPALSQTISANAISPFLQGIMIPKNTEQAMEILSSISTKKIGIPVQGGITRRYAIADMGPKTIIKEGPRRSAPIIVTKEVPAKKIVVQNPNVIQKGNQIVIPQNAIVQRNVKTVLPKNLVLQNAGEGPKKIVVIKNEVPKNVVQNKNYLAIPREVLQRRPAEVPQVPRVLVNPKRSEFVAVPQKKMPVGNGRVYLPAASPVLPVAPTKCLPQSKGQFLRKIPIPPPTL